MEIESACPEEEISDSTSCCAKMSCWTRFKTILAKPAVKSKVDKLKLLAALWTPGKA